jgi:Flp pilus assembly protein CpaB
MKVLSGATSVREPVPGRVNGAAATGGVPPARTPLATRQRKPGYAALGVLLIVGLAALGGYLYSTAGAKTPVVVVTQQVPAGHVVTAEDLSTVDVAGGVVAIAGSNLPSVLGQTATVDLLPNTLLQRSMVTAAPVLAADEAQVGVALRAGQLPADGVLPGDTVQVLQLPAKDAAASGAAATATVLVPQARVFSERPDPSVAGGWVVTVTVPTTSAAAVATASGLGAAALVMVRS